jgi:hypothetical protein
METYLYSFFVLLGVLGEAMQLTREETAAIKAIESKGGAVFYKIDSPTLEVETIRLKGRAFGDHELKLLRAFPTNLLFELGLIETSMTSKGFAEIERFRNLRGLSIVNIAEGGAVLDLLGNLPELRSFTLDNVTVPAVQLKHLSYLKHVESLCLGKCSINDDALTHLSALTNLSWLALGDNKITDRGIDHLTNLRKLDTLLLNNTLVTDVGVEKLTTFKELRVLRLDGSRITGQTLRQLMNCPLLEELSVGQTPVTFENIRPLQNHPTLSEIDLFHESRAERDPRWKGFWLGLPAIQKLRAKNERRCGPADSNLSQ